MPDTSTAVAGLPRLRLGIGSASKLPLYVQLADQVRYLIITGALRGGARLPSARSLSRNLGINRHTVLNAYGLLEREGLLEVRGAGGTRVATDARPTSGRISPDLLALIEDLVDRAGQAGLSPDELVALILSHFGARADAPPARIVFVECNPHSLEHYAGELRRALGLEVAAILLDDLDDPERQAEVARADLVASTFFHFAEVRKLVQASGEHAPKVVAITVSPHLSVLDEVSRLPKGTRLGIVYYAEDPYAEERLRRMTEAVRNVRLKNVKIKPVYLPPDFGPELFEHLDALIVRPENIAPVRDRLPAALPLIEFRNTLDDASIHMLREVLQELAPRAAPPVLPLEFAAAGARRDGRSARPDAVKKPPPGPRPSARATGANGSRVVGAPR